MSQQEIERGCEVCTLREGHSVTVVQPTQRPPKDRENFVFDAVFQGLDSEGNSQTEFFKETQDLVVSCLDGFNVCVFAYGQTGSGSE